MRKEVSIEIDEEIPENLFQINDYDGHNYICISMSGEDFGCIYYVGDEYSYNNYENIFHLSDSFTEFLDGLQPDGE